MSKLYMGRFFTEEFVYQSFGWICSNFGHLARGQPNILQILFANKIAKKHCWSNFNGFFPSIEDFLRRENMGLKYFHITFLFKNIKSGILLSPFHQNPGQREKNILNFYFHTSLWCLKRFYEGLKGPHKTFCGTTKKCENKNLS